MQIKIAKNVLVSLGGGKFVRADHVIALEPIEGEDRGSGSRTRVLIDHVAGEIIAGRTERSIVPDMQEREDGYTEQPFEATPYVEAMEEIHSALNTISPAMRGVLVDQGFDVGDLISTITSVTHDVYLEESDKEDILA